MNHFTLRQGTALKIEAELRDDEANITPYDPSTEFLTTIWPGNDRARSFDAITQASDPDNALIVIIISSLKSDTLERGRYQLLTEMTPPGGDTIACYQATIEIEAVAGIDKAPPVYCTYEDLLNYGRSWLRQLATVDDEAGFASQRGRARTWLEEVAYAHHPGSVWYRSTILRDAFEADGLLITPAVRECASRKALALICEGQVGLGEQSQQYARLARMYHAQADEQATCLILSIDTDGDGIADWTIDCTYVHVSEG